MSRCCFSPVSMSTFYTMFLSYRWWNGIVASVSSLFFVEFSFCWSCCSFQECSQRFCSFVGFNSARFRSIPSRLLLCWTPSVTPDQSWRSSSLTRSFVDTIILGQRRKHYPLFAWRQCPSRISNRFFSKNRSIRRRRRISTCVHSCCCSSLNQMQEINES